MGWFRLASHLGIPVGELQQRITSTEFLEWMDYLEEEVNDFHREDYYLAQIAAEIRRANCKEPTSVKVSDMLLLFKSSPSESTVEKDQDTKLQMSMNFWYGMLGAEVPEE